MQVGHRGGNFVNQWLERHETGQAADTSNSIAQLGRQILDKDTGADDRELMIDMLGNLAFAKDDVSTAACDKLVELAARKDEVGRLARHALKNGCVGDGYGLASHTLVPKERLRSIHQAALERCEKTFDGEEATPSNTVLALGHQCSDPPGGNATRDKIIHAMDPLPAGLLTGKRELTDQELIDATKRMENLELGGSGRVLQIRGENGTAALKGALNEARTNTSAKPLVVWVRAGANEAPMPLVFSKDQPTGPLRCSVINTGSGSLKNILGECGVRENDISELTPSKDVGAPGGARVTGLYFLDALNLARTVEGEQPGGAEVDPKEFLETSLDNWNDGASGFAPEEYRRHMSNAVLGSELLDPEDAEADDDVGGGYHIAPLSADRVNQGAIDRPRLQPRPQELLQGFKDVIAFVNTSITAEPKAADPKAEARPGVRNVQQKFAGAAAALAWTAFSPAQQRLATALVRANQACSARASQVFFTNDLDGAAKIHPALWQAQNDFGNVAGVMQTVSRQPLLLQELAKDGGEAEALRQEIGSSIDKRYAFTEKFIGVLTEVAEREPQSPTGGQARVLANALTELYVAMTDKKGLFEQMATFGLTPSEPLSDFRHERSPQQLQN